MPNVSVIITTYRRPELLEEAIRSVLSQTFTDFELVIVDDASLDDTRKVATSFQDDRISYICHETNKGDAAAKNTGIRSAKGQYVISLDDDDLFVPWTLERLVERMEGDGVSGGAYGWSWWVYDHGKTLKILAATQEGSLSLRILSHQLFTNILLKREVFEKIGLYDEKLRSNYDHDFYLRLAKAYAIEAVPEILFVIRLQGKHLSEISLPHMRSHEEVTRRYDSHARKKAVVLLNVIPASLYVRLSVFKHKIFTMLRFITNPALKKQIEAVRQSLEGEGIAL
ncbi:MAG: glycosyltransferase [bacterium]|nr:glycosyltransferase [bacterium]